MLSNMLQSSPVHDRSVMDGSTDNKVIVIWNVSGGEVGIDDRFKERVRVSSVWYFLSLFEKPSEMEGWWRSIPH